MGWHIASDGVEAASVSPTVCNEAISSGFTSSGTTSSLKPLMLKKMEKEVNEEKERKRGHERRRKMKDYTKRSVNKVAV